MFFTASFNVNHGPRAPFFLLPQNNIILMLVDLHELNPFFFVLFSSNPTLSFIISQIFKLPLRGTEKMNPAQRSTSSLTLTVVSPHTPCCVNSV